VARSSIPPPFVAMAKPFSVEQLEQILAAAPAA